MVPVNPLMVTFNEYMSCPHHRDLVLGLSAILQVGLILHFLLSLLHCVNLIVLW